MVRAAALIYLLAQSASPNAVIPNGIIDNVVVGFDATGSLWMIRGSDFATRNENGMSGWVEVDHRRDKTIRAARTMMQVYISCSERKMMIQQSVQYARNGVVISQYQDHYATSNTATAVPGSIGDDVIAEVCDKK